MVAVRSWNGLWWVRAHSSWAVPGYSWPSRRSVSVARPFGERGLPERAVDTGERGLPGIPLPCHSVHHLEVKRQMGKGDIAAVSELLDVAEKADGHKPLGDHQRRDLAQG